MSEITPADIITTMKWLPGEKECIESVVRASTIKMELCKIMGCTFRYIQLVEALTINFKLGGNTLAMLLVAPIADNNFIYPVSNIQLSTLLKFVEMFKHELPHACAKLRESLRPIIDRVEAENTVKATGLTPDQLIMVDYFRKHPEHLRYGITTKFPSVPVYYVSDKMIDIYNTLEHHRMAGQGSHVDPVLAVPVSKATCKILTLPKNFPKEGYYPVCDLDAKLILLVPFRVIEERYKILDPPKP